VRDQAKISKDLAPDMKLENQEKGTKEREGGHTIKEWGK
jgi:hypothetical protein